MKYMKYLKSPDAPDASKRHAIYVDLEGLESRIAMLSPEQIHELCIFRTNTFQALTSKSSDTGTAAWVVLFEPANQFFKTLSDDDLMVIAGTLMNAHVEISSFSSYLKTTETTERRSQLQQRVSEIGTIVDKLVSDLDDHIHLYDKIHAFTLENINRVYLENAGQRAQDSADMTFFPDEIDQLTSISVLCKVLSPIIGIFIDSFNTTTFENKYAKEICCSRILDSILNKYEVTRKLLDKLEHYVERILRVNKAEVDFTQAFNGYTPEVAVEYTLAVLLVKKFVTVDLDSLSRGIGAYICTSINGIGKHPITNQRKHSSARKMLVPSDRDYDDDQSNSSILEAASIVSEQTDDYKHIIGLAVDVAKARFCAAHDLDLALADEVAQYYRSNQVKLQPVNSYLLGMIFGNYLGGAKSVDMLMPSHVNMLVALAQLWLCKHNYIEIAVLMSATKGVLEVDKTGGVAIVQVSWDRSAIFKNCDAKLPYRSASRVWSGALKHIVNDITTVRYSYNLAPGIVGIIKSTMSAEDGPVDVPANGSPISIVESIPRDISAVTYEWI